MARNAHFGRDTRVLALDVIYGLDIWILELLDDAEGIHRLRRTWAYTIDKLTQQEVQLQWRDAGSWDKAGIDAVEDIGGREAQRRRDKEGDGNGEERYGAQGAWCRHCWTA